MADHVSDDTREPVRPDAAPRPGAGSGGHQVVVAGGDGAAVDPALEKDIWSGRTSWRHFLGSILLWLVASIVVLFVSLKFKSADGSYGTILKWDAIIIVALGLVVFVRMLLKILGLKFRLTTQRLFIERGILSQTIDQTELIRVDDVRVRKSLTDRLLGLGSIEVKSTDVTDESLTIVGIDEPESVAESIRTHMRQLRRKSLFVENL